MNLNVQNVQKSFANYQALKGVDLTVPSGTLCALVGPSGCGKTTLLRIIAGLERADSGAVYFDDKAVDNLPVQKRNIGFVFQNYALFRHLNVRQNIAFALDIKGKRDNARVDELLTLIGLPDIGDKRVHTLSGGQAQRVALARALASDPKILLLDEPFGALDAHIRKDLRTALKKIQQNLGISAIMVTHDLHEAVDIAEQIVVMQNGQIMQAGDIHTLQQSPANDFVRNFLHGF